MCECVCHIFFIHSSIDGHVSCFHVLDIVSNAIMNMEMQMSLWDPDFNSSGHIFRDGIAGSNDNYVYSF